MQPELLYELEDLARLISREKHHFPQHSPQELVQSFIIEVQGSQVAKNIKPVVREPENSIYFWWCLGSLGNFLELIR